MLPKEREYLVLDNLNLVHYILQNIHHLNPYYRDYDDYYQEGCIGLILAAIRFDESKGFLFSTYASSMISGCIRRYKREKGYTIRLPRAKLEMIMKVSNLSSQGYTIGEIKELTGFTYYDIQKAINNTNIDSLDRVILDEQVKECTLYEVISDGSDYYSDLLSQEHIQDCIYKITDSIQDDTHRAIWEEWIWSTYYGEEHTQIYYAKKYGISQSLISRILNKYKDLFEKEFYK